MNSRFQSLKFKLGQNRPYGKALTPSPLGPDKVKSILALELRTSKFTF